MSGDNAIQTHRSLNKVARSMIQAGVPVTKSEVAEDTGLSLSYVGRLITRYIGRYFNETPLGYVMIEDMWNSAEQQVITVDPKQDLQVKYPEVIQRLDRIESKLNNIGSNSSVESKKKDLYDEIAGLMRTLHRRELADSLVDKMTLDDLPYGNQNDIAMLAYNITLLVKKYPRERIIDLIESNR